MTKTDDILSKYSLTRDTAIQYIDGIIRMNQSQTADEVGVSRDTINRYKKAFSAMTEEERALLLATLYQEKLLENYV